MTIPPVPYTSVVPCAQWADALAAPQDHLSPAEHVRLDEHVATCSACAAVRDEYRRMDAQIRTLPAPPSLSALPPALLDLWAREDTQPAIELALGGMAGEVSDARGNPSRVPASSRRRRATAALRALAAVAILGALIGGYYAVVTSHAPVSPPSSGAIHYGPPVDPAGPRASVGAWRTLALPPGAPDRARQVAQPGAAGGQPTGGAQVYEQPAVVGLLYAVSPPAGATPLRMWRSEDAGRTWQPLALPARATALPGGAQTLLVLDARAPDGVLFWGYTLGSASSVRLYSLDRGATWHSFQMPPGSDAWNVSLPLADRGVWYLPVWIATQPAIWITRDHGATWTSHAYPVRMPDRTLGEQSLSGALLNVDYARGGLLWAYQHTLWWSPDDGATWRRLGKWGAQPCDGTIAGTPDLAVLYCLFSNGPVYGPEAPDQRPMWRSDDRGQTWTAIPGGPPVPPLASDPTGGLSHAAVLSDGSLLTVAPSHERPDEVAFYTLKRGANVWHEASAPLPPPLGYCFANQVPSPGESIAIAPECATPLEFTVTAGAVTGGAASQIVYITHATPSAVTNPVYVATITWK